MWFPDWFNRNDTDKPTNGHGDHVQAYELNEIELPILSLCMGDRTVTDIVREVGLTFESDYTTPFEEVGSLVRRLSQEGILDASRIIELSANIDWTKVKHFKSTGFVRAPHEQILKEVSAHVDQFRPRSVAHSRDWMGLDVILNWEWTESAQYSPTFVSWLQGNVPWLPNRAYIARLEPRGQISWHADYLEQERFSSGFLLGLHSPKGSFIQFSDGTKYAYEDGMSYHATLGASHRVVNPTEQPRVTAFVGSPQKRAPCPPGKTLAVAKV